MAPTTLYPTGERPFASVSSPEGRGPHEGRPRRRKNRGKAPEQGCRSGFPEMVHTVGKEYHSGCRIREMRHIGHPACIQIDQLLRSGFVADDARSLRTWWERNRIPLFQVLFTLRSVHDGMTPDDVNISSFTSW